MTTRTKIYIALFCAAVLLAIVLIASSALTDHRIHKLEANANKALSQAAASEKRAADLEEQAAENAAKIELLENSLDAIKDIARKQDEQIKTLNSNSGRARAGLSRARGVRSVDATVTELCQRLADVGHACQ